MLNGQLFKKTVETSWDVDSMTVNKSFVSKEMFDAAEDWMQPCVDVSSFSIRMFSQLSVFNVKDDNGNKVYDLWKVLDSSNEIDYLPPGSHDLIYLSNMTTQQIGTALPIRSFYDIFFNSSKKRTSPAIALCALQMLWQQNKLDYLNDMYKFLHWYYINCRFPIEYCKQYPIKEG